MLYIGAGPQNARRLSRRPPFPIFRPVPKTTTLCLVNLSLSDSRCEIFQPLPFLPTFRLPFSGITTLDVLVDIRARNAGQGVFNAKNAVGMRDRFAVFNVQARAGERCEGIDMVTCSDERLSRRHRVLRPGSRDSDPTFRVRGSS